MSNCHLSRLGLCPECEHVEQEELDAAHDAWVDNTLKWEQEERVWVR